MVIFRSVVTQLGIILFKMIAPIRRQRRSVITVDTSHISGPVIAIHAKEQQSNQDLLLKGYIDFFFKALLL